MSNNVGWRIFLLVLFGFTTLAPAQVGAAGWDPVAFAEESTLDFRSDCADEGEHWSPVWLSVLDGKVYIALGSKAEERMSCNKPKTAIRIGAETFESVNVVSAEEMADRIETARREKYWTNIFVKGFEHKYYVLEPDSQ